MLVDKFASITSHISKEIAVATAAAVAMLVTIGMVVVLEHEESLLRSEFSHETVRRLVAVITPVPIKIAVATIERLLKRVIPEMP